MILQSTALWVRGVKTKKEKKKEERAENEGD